MARWPFVKAAEVTTNKATCASYCEVEAQHRSFILVQAFTPLLTETNRTGASTLKSYSDMDTVQLSADAVRLKVRLFRWLEQNSSSLTSVFRITISNDVSLISIAFDTMGPLDNPMPTAFNYVFDRNDTAATKIEPNNSKPKNTVRACTNCVRAKAKCSSGSTPGVCERWRFSSTTRPYALSADEHPDVIEWGKIVNLLHQCGNVASPKSFLEMGVRHQDLRRKLMGWWSCWSSPEMVLWLLLRCWRMVHYRGLRRLSGVNLGQVMSVPTLMY